MVSKEVEYDIAIRMHSSQDEYRPLQWLSRGGGGGGEVVSAEGGCLPTGVSAQGGMPNGGLP